MSKAISDFIPLNIAILTISDTRTQENDTSGDYLEQQLMSAGHRLADRQLIPDDIYRMRAVVSQWIADPDVHCVLTSGGTGFTGRDSTPEAIVPLFDKTVDGFGELFRHYSLAEIGSATLQSRALAGMANRTLIFCMPGSTNACKTAWSNILLRQLDSRTQPCNFVPNTLAAAN